MTIRADEEEETKLHAAVRLHSLKLVRAALRDEGLDLDAQGAYGWTALHEAASSGYLDIVILLLEHGADPDIQDSYQKCTPIHLAAKNGHLEVVRSLVRSGARLDLRNAKGKIPQDWADDECREFLQRERIADVIKVNPTPIEEHRSVQKLYGPRSSQSPVLKKVRQASPQWSESSQSSRESMASSSSGSSDSFYESSMDLRQPGPGEISFSLNFNRERQTLIVHIGELREIKLPADHNFSHIYLKTYVVPDHKKATKCKTRLFRLGPKGAGQTSSSSVTNLDNEEDDHRKYSGKHASQKLVSSLKRGARFSLKKKKDKEQVSSLQKNMFPFFRISTIINETFRYDSAHLRKVNFDTSSIMLSLWGRNEVTSQAQPIACLSIPFSGCIKYATPDWHPLVYRIILPDDHCVEEQQPLRSFSSWEQQDAKFSGTKRRSLAWNDHTKSMSMPNIELSTSSPPTSQTFPRTSQGGEGGFPTEGSRRYKKHSGAGKMLKKELKIIRGKTNYRYQNSAAEETAVGDFSNDIEVSSPSALPPRPSYTGSDLNVTLREQNRDIASKIRALPRNKMKENRRNTMSHLDSSLHDEVTEVMSFNDEETTSRPAMQHRSSFASSLKYSRAFQQKNSAQRRDVVLNDTECEDLETEIETVPCAVSNFYGRKTGIVCN